MSILAPEEREGISRDGIFAKVEAGNRISPEEALWLFENADPLTLSTLATIRRQQKAPGRVVTYVVGRILNYTNVCWVRCKFCAFYRVPNHAEGYTLSEEEILEKVRHTVETAEELQISDCGLRIEESAPQSTDSFGTTQIRNPKSEIRNHPDSVEILFQGGLNPKLKVDWYEDIFRKIKAQFPQVTLHALSPAEVIYIAAMSKLTLKDCLQRFKDAGMNSIPGAGGEILVDRVRKIISPYKDTTDEWLACMRTAASLGLKSSASMMFGHVETLADRVEHLARIRDLQDECAPFRAFVTWSFQPEDTQLPIAQKASSWDYLRTLAVSRIFLDNFENVQLSILTQGPKIAQVGLNYGANDFGSIMIEENVVSAKGNKFIISAREFERLISEAGYAPRRRNTRYELV